MWRSGGGVTTSGGVAQLWKAVAGQTIGCTWGNWRAEAKVDAAGIYYSRVQDYSLGGDTGWVLGATAYSPYDGVTFSQGSRASTTLAGVTLESGNGTLPTLYFRCEARWS